MIRKHFLPLMSALEVYTKESVPLQNKKRSRIQFESQQQSEGKIEEKQNPVKKSHKGIVLKAERLKVNVFWFRRDLRLNDNTGLYYALRSQLPVVPYFIFDTSILDDLFEKKDARVEFIHKQILRMQSELREVGSSIVVHHGTVDASFDSLCAEYDVQTVFTNRDYEKAAKQRDLLIKEKLDKTFQTKFIDFKDQVIFEAEETNREPGQPYKVFTPYSKKWLGLLKPEDYQCKSSETLKANFLKMKQREVISLKALGFEQAGIPFPPIELNEKIVKTYDKTRDFPSIEGTSRMSVHLRFGTVSIRELVRRARILNTTYLNELIWRDFYMMILDQYPESEKNNFKSSYDKVKWRNDPIEFDAWKNGKTGYHIVDAGMRQLNETGYMHNRLRMIVASFLTKHLLIDWKWGERYFAEKLLDFDLAANVGGWQWAAGTGTDSQPYFRIFNPDSQQKKFDPDLLFIKRYVKDLNTKTYPSPIVDHKFARERCLKVYKAAVNEPQQ